MNKLQNTFSILKEEFRIAAKTIFKSPIINYYGTSFQKNALVSYISNPFRKNPDLSHTNSFEALEIGSALNAAGFNVDIADYDYRGFINYSKYKLIFGFGNPLVNSFYNRKHKIVSVYYGTGMHINTQNYNSLIRIKEVYNKKGVFLPGSGRIVDKAWSIQTTLIDAMVLLGNQEVTNSYTPYFKGKTFNIPAMYLKVIDFNDIIASKNFNDARNHFLWFGSSGLIHKGLDLLLEIFSRRKDIYLHICGPLDNEPEFKIAYSDELNNKENIYYHGFVGLNSAFLEELLKKCAFVIFPSCSEGGSPAVLNICGNGGLIPLLSKEATIDVDDFGFIFNEITRNDIQSVIDTAIKMTDEEIKEKSIKCGNIISTKNSRSNYSLELKKCINEITGSKRS
jgi:glycosyltransferase involved in cell wall biosynthesis